MEKWKRIVWIVTSLKPKRHITHFWLRLEYPREVFPGWRDSVLPAAESWPTWLQEDYGGRPWARGWCSPEWSCVACCWPTAQRWRCPGLGHSAKDTVFSNPILLRKVPVLPCNEHEWAQTWAEGSEQNHRLSSSAVWAVRADCGTIKLRDVDLAGAHDCWLSIHTDGFHLEGSDFVWIQHFRLPFEEKSCKSKTTHGSLHLLLCLLSLLSLS